MSSHFTRMCSPLHTKRGGRLSLYSPFYSNKFGLLLMLQRQLSSINRYDFLAGAGIALPGGDSFSHARA